jgi:hypothetical protein
MFIAIQAHAIQAGRMTLKERGKLASTRYAGSGQDIMPNQYLSKDKLAIFDQPFFGGLEWSCVLNEA